MMELSMMPVREPVSEVRDTDGYARRPPTRELLPQGSRRAVVLTAGAALSVGSLADFGLSGQALIGLVLCPALVLLAAIDLEHRLLPNQIVLPASMVVAVIVAGSHTSAFPGHLAIGVALGGFFFAFAAFFPGSLGMGDAKLGFLLGLALGPKTLPAMEVAFLGLLLAALWVLVRQGLAARKKTLPFGPFLALGGILGFFLG
jgi:leader peptidase (prepilin peptidase) / N-methyltransferase